MQPSNAVVVGYDGTGRALSALTWAAREAAVRDLPLHVICVTPYAAVPAREAGSAGEGSTLTADRALAEGIRIASALRGADWVSGTCSVGRPAGVLVEASDRAALLVVGPPSQDDPAASAFGSTSLVLADRARCPVVVARGATGPERSALPVVVGVDDEAGSRAALDFAAHSAQLRGVELTIVAPWSLPPTRKWSRATGGRGGVAQLARDLMRRAAALVETSEVQVHRHHPSVVTGGRAEWADAAIALDWASHQAGLLVVTGPSGGSGLDEPGELQGRRDVARALLGRAACPVVVMPLSRTARETAPPDLASDPSQDRASDLGAGSPALATGPRSSGA